MRKIGVLEPIWNQEPFIIPHFQMLKGKVDRIVVLLGSQPLPQYSDEHGYSYKADRSEELLRTHFPEIEIYPSHYTGMFGAPLYNEGLTMMQDCDIVLTLDTDMLFTAKDLDQMLDFIRTTDYDCYRLNYETNSINYYKDFDHGLKDAKEHDPRAINPKFLYEWVLNYPFGKQYEMQWENFMCHHFRGWNKPKTITPFWEDSPYAKEAFTHYANNGAWYTCPEEIRDMFDPKTRDSWLGRFKGL